MKPSSTAPSAESSAGLKGGSSVHVVFDAELRAQLARRAAGGHSPSARALVNASDWVGTLALSAPPAEPSSGLRDRVIRGAKPRAGAAPPGVAASRDLLAPHDLLTRLHVERPDDLVRRAFIDALGAAGGPGHEESDAAIGRLLERMAPFMDFEVVLVSAVRGGETVHRVHRGFPAALGNVDVVPRAVSFCTHCVSADEPMIVHDASAEAFFRQGVMVRQMGARTYLGVPIRAGVDDAPASRREALSSAMAALGADATEPPTPRRIGVGALCCIGTSARTIAPTELGVLEAFAEEAEAIVVGDAARLSHLRAPARDAAADVPEDVAGEAHFRRIVDAVLAHHRAIGGAPPMLLVGPVAENGNARAWSRFLRERARVIGSIEGKSGEGTSGERRSGGGESVEVVLLAPGALDAAPGSSDRLLERLPGVHLCPASAGAASAFASGDAWIAAALLRRGA